MRVTLLFLTFCFFLCSCANDFTRHQDPSLVRSLSSEYFNRDDLINKNLKSFMIKELSCTGSDLQQNTKFQISKIMANSWFDVTGRVTTIMTFKRSNRPEFSIMAETKTLENGKIVTSDSGSDIMYGNFVPNEKVFKFYFPNFPQVGAIYYRVECDGQSISQIKNNHPHYPQGTWVKFFTYENEPCDLNKVRFFKQNLANSTYRHYKQNSSGYDGGITILPNDGEVLYGHTKYDFKVIYSKINMHTSVAGIHNDPINLQGVFPAYLANENKRLELKVVNDKNETLFFINRGKVCAHAKSTLYTTIRGFENDYFITDSDIHPTYR